MQKDFEYQALTPAGSTGWHLAYGRRTGRRLSTRRAELIKNLLPQLEIKQNKDVQDVLDVNIKALFGRASQLCLEVGFGGGEHLAACASAHPDWDFIGCEYYISGIASLLRHIEDKKLKNIRIFHGHAETLLKALPNKCLHRCTVLFPDPWPKPRHAKRRFLQTHTCETVSQLLQDTGEFRLASDHPIMIEWMEMHLTALTNFEVLIGRSRTDVSVGDDSQGNKSWPETRYERKALGMGLTPKYFRAMKRAL